MLVGHLLGGAQGLLIGLVLGGFGNLIAYFYSDKLALTAMQAQEVTRKEAPWPVDTVEQLAMAAGIPAPRVCVCPQEAPTERRIAALSRQAMDFGGGDRPARVLHRAG